MDVDSHPIVVYSNNIPYGWSIDGYWSVGEIRMAETEKITLNVSPVDLGHIDLLVEEGFYSNRSDFMRTAIRNLLTQHAPEVDRVVVRRSMVVGMISLSARELARRLEKGEQIEANVVGVLHLGSDITP